MTDDTPADATPFGGTLHDFVLCDATQPGLFGAVGRTHGPFRGMDAWPNLADFIGNYSADLLARSGETAWLRAGGVMDSDGRPSLRRAGGTAAVAAMRALAEGPGGFVWQDAAGFVWPVRLVPAAGEGHNAYWGLSFSWQMAASLARQGPSERPGPDALVVDSPAPSDPGAADLQTAARALRLYERAELLLWSIHAAVLRQRCSLVRLPDVWLAQLAWGGKTRRPPRWRQDLLATLFSLQALRLAVMRIPRSGWQPRFGALSVPVSYVEDLRTMRPELDVCAAGCPLHGVGMRHGHFLVGVGYGFLGALELFATREDGQGVREFDFVRHPKGKGKELAAAHKAGRLVSVHLPTKLLGPAAGVGASARMILDALVREVTRVPKHVKSDRPDRAALVAGGPSTASGGGGRPYDRRLPPGLWASFNGNGYRRGKGYLLVGAKGTGWLDKAGFAAAAESPPEARRNAAQSFLRELAAMADPFGLVAYGADPRGGVPLDLDDLVRLAAVESGWERLGRLHLRIFGPADYPERWRRRLAEAAGFDAVPQAATAALETAEGAGPDKRPDLDLWLEMDRRRLTRRGLAKHLVVSPAFVSKLYHQKRRWPEGMLARAWRYVQGEQAAVRAGAVPVRGCGMAGADGG